jgi:Potential Queuosine, Q, salvage protein family
MSLVDEVRESSAAIAASARSVRIDEDAIAAYRPAPAEPEPLDPLTHYLEGPPEDVARFLLTLDAINFGSGWFPTLRKRDLEGRPMSGYFTVAWRLTDHVRAHGPWTNAELRAMRTDVIADVLHQQRDHELMSLYAQALRQLGTFLGDRSVMDLVVAARGSAVALAEGLVRGMSMFADRGFYKRAQIVPNDLALASVATFRDLDRLTIFADNLVPHVLRCDGVLVYDERLARHIDAGRPLRMGTQEREIRGCAVHACELIAQRQGVPPRVLDMWLWNRGQAPEYKARPRHRCRTVYY